jgi:hypothetical protein
MFSNPLKSDIENLAFVLKNNGYYTLAYIGNKAASPERLGISESFNNSLLNSRLSYNNARNPRDILKIVLSNMFRNKIRIYDWFISGDFHLTNTFLQPVDQIYYKFIHKKNIARIRKTGKAYVGPFGDFLSTIDNDSLRPYFSWIHLFPPHDPYMPPDAFKGTFNSSPMMRTVSEQKAAFKKIYKDEREHGYHTHEALQMVKTLRARYDEYIKYCDKAFEDLITHLKNKNKLENTIIILSSDHGESFEHDYFLHGRNHLYEQVTHIPLIIKEHGQVDGQIIENKVEQIDIPATILDLAKISIPSWMEGRSLVPLLKGERISDSPIFSMYLQRNRRWHRITTGTIAVWDGDYKLIHFLESKNNLLFNLKQDPSEMKNLFDIEPEIGTRLLMLIQNNLEKANRRIKK